MAEVKQLNKAERITGINLGQWEVKKPSDPDQYYNCDAIIEAYLKGTNDGLAHNEKLFFKEFSSNIEKANQFVIEVLSNVENTGSFPKGAFLKFKSWDNFNVIILVNESDFIKPDFLTNYDFLSDFEAKVKSEFFSLKFSFMCADDEDIEDNLKSDGYIIKFSPIDAASAR